mmetsp:Transcript_37892/g.109319  ORF Transcript_37892/g.109319 Transcript_37892/m.109319 type:complete len:195 (-) Transcript_37892:57-641(-)
MRARLRTHAPAPPVRCRWRSTDSKTSHNVPTPPKVSPRKAECPAKTSRGTGDATPGSLPSSSASANGARLRNGEAALQHRAFEEPRAHDGAKGRGALRRAPPDLALWGRDIQDRDAARGVGATDVGGVGVEEADVLQPTVLEAAHPADHGGLGGLRPVVHHRIAAVAVAFIADNHRKAACDPSSRTWSLDGMAP